MIYFDAHCDTILDLERNHRSLAERSALGHIDLPRLKQAGVRFQVFALFVQACYRPHGDWDRCLEMARQFRQALEDCGPQVEWVTRAGQLEAARDREEVTCALLAVEGGSMLGERLDRLEQLFALGVRSLTLTWNQRNAIASGVGDEEDGGLTPFGRQVVARMEKLGMAVDLAHISPKGFWDVLEAARKPVLFSHGNARALTDHPRNLTDRQLRGLSQNGGLVGVCYVPAFVGLDQSVDGVVRHIDYICQTLGTAAHTCLGSDFDGTANQPMSAGLEDVTRVPAIAQGLERLGYSQEDIAGIAWRNLYHYYRNILPV